MPVRCSDEQFDNKITDFDGTCRFKAMYLRNTVKFNELNAMIAQAKIVYGSENQMYPCH